MSITSNCYSLLKSFKIKNFKYIYNKMRCFSKNQRDSVNQVDSG